MKNKEVYDLYEGLYEISQNQDLKFNIKLCYSFAKNKNILEPFYNAIIETRQRFLSKYGTPQENGDGWTVAKDRMDDFLKEWNDFMNIDNFVVLQHIKLEELEDEEKLGIDLMEKLLPIIDV